VGGFLRWAWVAFKGNGCCDHSAGSGCSRMTALGQ
jgi:hypothetical protein